MAWHKVGIYEVFVEGRKEGEGNGEKGKEKQREERKDKKESRHGLCPQKAQSRGNYNLDGN